METRDPRDARIVELEALVAAQAAKIAELEEVIRRLTARLGLNSLNSSLPPSRDDAKAREGRARKPKSRRKRGGQKGHKGAKRALLPADQVDAVAEHVPSRCCACDRRLRGTDPEPRRRQIIELPPIKAEVTEHRFHSLKCVCGAVTCAETPPELQHGDVGPRLSALVATLSGAYRISKRNIQSLASDILGITISLGLVPKLEARVSEAIAPLHDQVQQHVRASSFVNMDETPWVEGRKTAWLWVATTRDAALYVIAPERSAAIVREILGDEFCGIVGSDRAKAYLVINPEKRQLCWFHLGRNFQSKIELGGDDAIFGRRMRAFERRLWRAQHLLESGSIDRASYDRRMKMLRGEVLRAIDGYAAAAADPTVGVGAMCHNLLALEPALWNFVDHPNVDPTNNRAERDIRHPVIWRRSSFGTDSPRGSRFVERVLSVIATCRKQARSPFRFLADFLASAWGPAPQQPPRLLPDSS